MTQKKNKFLDIDRLEQTRKTQLAQALLAICLVASLVILPLDIFLNGFDLKYQLLRLPVIPFCIIAIYFLRKDTPNLTNRITIGFCLAWLILPMYRFWHSPEDVQFFMFFGPLIFAGVVLNKRWTTLIYLVTLAISLIFTNHLSLNPVSEAVMSINILRAILIAYLTAIWLILLFIQSGFAYTRKQIQAQSETLSRSLNATKLSQNKFASLIENAPEAIFLFDRKTFSIQLANEKACELVGLTESKIIKSGTQFFIPPSVNSELYKHLLQSSDSDNETVVKSTKFEAIVLHPNGTKIPCDVEIVKFNLEQESLYRVSLFDIRERQVQEAELYRQARIIQQINDAVYTTDEDSVINSWNQAAVTLYGWREDQAIGRNARTLLTDAAQKEIVDDRIQSALDKGYWQGDLQHFHKDRHLLDLSVSITMVRDSHDDFNGFIVVAKDIAEQKKAKEALNQSERIENLGVLAGSIAHDFNNLLAAIQLEGSIAEHQLESSHPAHQNLVRMNGVAEKAGLLIGQMLAYSGKGQTAVTQFNLNTLLNENLQLLISTIPPTIQLGLHFDNNLALVSGDEAQVHQVIMNLLLNAVDSIGETVGRIDVQTEYKFMAYDTSQYWQFSGQLIEEGYYNVIHFIDSGSGIDEETIAQIFDPFFSTKHNGSGLGLAAVLGIMRGHNGGIHVYSKRDIGSKFSLYFPATTEPALDNELEKEDNTLTLPPFSKKVLVVDDDEDVQTAVCSTFNLFNIPFIQAKGGRAGIELFTQHQDEIGLIFLDMKMPDIDGDTVYQAISELNPNINVLVSSGYHESEIMPLFIGSSKNVSFIPKPFNINALINALQEPLKS